MILRQGPPSTGSDRDTLLTLVRQHPKLVVLTGAGVSSHSGIPTYRNDQGEWRGRRPVQHREFITQEASRRRYWSRSVVGWRRVAESSPNQAHHALVALERSGYLDLLATQNVDRLHQRAGHQQVVDLHGRLDQVLCRNCGAALSRARLQVELEALNPSFLGRTVEMRPDGDAHVHDRDAAGFRIPSCADCGGMLMPDVVFFGGQVPKARVARISRAIGRSDALLVVGSSLAVYSGFRFCRLARSLAKPLLIVNRGRTRADDIADLKVEADCASALDQLVRGLHVALPA